MRTMLIALKEPPHNEGIEGLLAVWKLTERTAFRREGLRWYLDAHKSCKALARKHGLKLSIACGVVAALSPRLNWDLNLVAADKFIGGEGLSRCLGANLRRAEQVLQGRYDWNRPSAPKVRAFYRNLLNPWEREHVTIDSWAARTYFGPTYKLGKFDYEEVAEAYKQASKHLRLIPNQFQAVLWLFERAGRQLSLPFTRRQTCLSQTW